VKIAILGGGSAYAPGLVAAFAEKADAFDGAELFLMDVAEAELQIVARLARRLLEGTSLTVRAGTDGVVTLACEGGRVGYAFDTLAIGSQEL
jgi:alpha-galactosidase/6-phospho-beta-glucosidase family protein